MVTGRGMRRSTSGERGWLRRAAPLLAAAVVLTGCSDDGAGTASPPARTPAPTPSSTVSVPPGVTLTAPGTTRDFGQPADVVYEPGKDRGTTLRLTVEGARRGSVDDLSGFDLDKQAKRAAYYYVTVTVRNTGEGDVGGGGVPLWGVDEDEVLLPPVRFTTRFDPCRTKALPKRFEHGDALKTCLVFLVPHHGELTAVSYRPEDAYDPIRWTGRITGHR